MDLQIDQSTRPNSIRVLFDSNGVTFESVAERAKEALESDPFLPQPYVIRYLN